MTLTAVGNLLFLGCPTAVSGFVVPVVIDAVKRQAGRGFAHICEEVFEDQPTFADGDAAASPIFKAMMSGIEASLFHRSPAAVNARLFGVVSVFGDDFAVEASAALGSFCGQVSSVEDRLNTTIAQAQPLAIFFTANDGQSSEAPIREIDETHWIVSHNGGSNVKFQ